MIYVTNDDLIGIYARRWDLNKEEIDLDDLLWSKLPVHNELVFNQIKALSNTAHVKNRTVSEDFKIPNWTSPEWTDQRDSFLHASNVIVTCDDFSNVVHTDQDDLNGYTYGLFSYIEKPTGTPIPPPSTETGHGLSFPTLGFIVDYAKVGGIEEILWQTSVFPHHTTFPPPSLQSTEHHTRFGCSFQIKKS